MKISKELGCGFVCLFQLILSSAPAWSQEKSNKEKIDELSKKVDVLTKELESQRIEGSIELDQKGKYGMGPGASKVYQKKSGVSIGGYGELTYRNQDNRNQSGSSVSASDFPDTVDVLRIVLYFGYKFTDNFLFNTEIEYEHANELGVEFAYIDYLWKSYLNFRAGLLLAPMGFVNELHEPPIFLGVHRPQVEKYIIPTTWREVGAGLFGSWEWFTYKFYVMNSFNGIKFSSKGLRGGRQKGSKAFAEDIGAVFRVDYQYNLLLIGASSFIGETGQTDERFAGFNTISDGHLDFVAHGVYFRLLFSFATLTNVVTINEINKVKSSSSVGEQLLGGYFQLGYNIFHLLQGEQKLILFARYEYVDTQYKVPQGFQKNPKNENHIITLGFSFKPIINISIKSDYQFYLNDAKTGVNQFNLGLGYFF